jgi:hypothetical protein
MLVEATREWYELAWVDWVSVIGFPIGITGLVLTWLQARGAYKTAEATQKTMIEAQNQLRANQLMTLIPQLRWTTAELDLAIKLNDSDLAVRQLEHWKWQIGYIRGIIKGLDGVSSALLVKLQNSVTLAATSSNALVGTNKEVRSACIKARKAIGDACDALIPLLGERSTQVSDRR